MIIQRNVEIIEDVLMQDIDTGYTYLNIGRHAQVTEEGREVITCDYQFRVKLPVDFDAVIKEIEDNNVIASLQADISNMITAAGLRSKDVDEAIQKIAESETYSPIVQLFDGPRTSESDDAVEILKDKGIVIITNV